MEGLGIVSMFTTALTDVGPELLGVAGGAIGIGVIVLVVKRGWSLVKRFTN